MVPATQEKSIAAQCHQQLINSLAPSHHLVAYSDGSRLENSVGAGFYIIGQPEIKVCYGLGRMAEVFDAELFGCLKACQRMEKLATRLHQIKDCWVFLDNSALCFRDVGLKFYIVFLIFDSYSAQ